MSVITFSLDDNVETEFRSYIEKETDNAKGIMGKIISEALEKWLKEKKQKEIAKRAMEIMHKGFNLGSYKIKSRSELHER